MADHTEISWTDATWSPITGCSIKSTGCQNCYAMRLAGTRLRNHPSRAGLTREVNGKHVWTGEVRFNEQWLDQPLRWEKPKDIFVVAHGDLAHEGVSDEWLDRIFAVMALAPWHRFQVLTKRPDRLLRYCSDPTIDWPLKQCWIGTSVERQPEADERREHLAAIARMGWNTWISYEPALGPVDWSGWEFARWVVSGGESGPDARPSHPDWHRNTRDWCAENSVPYHFKQWGSWISVYDRDVDDPDWRRCPQDGDWSRARYHNLAGGCGFHGERVQFMRRVGKKAGGALLDGVEHQAMPTPKGPGDE